MHLARHAAAVTAVLVLSGIAPAAAVELSESFDAGSLDASLWNPCQSDGRLIGFGREAEDAGGRSYLVNTVTEARGDAACTQAASTVAGLIPAGLVATANAAVASRVQRNELRLAGGKRRRHAIDDAHWYALSFRMAGDIPVTGSVRWVTAQWKYDGAWPHAWPQSPFLAQRFDNGVLHVTVQADRCRCTIASAPGDPDVGGPVPPPPLSAAAGRHPGGPLKCVWTGGGPSNGALCEPENLRITVPSSGAPVSLPDPRRGWVRMAYRVSAGPEGGGRIDVYADGRFIVRAEGAIGYHGGTPGPVKFKFGNYRDRMPGTAQMMVDAVCVSRTAATCGVADIEMAMGHHAPAPAPEQEARRSPVPARLGPGP